MTKYISFNVPKVLDFLLTQGHVYTIRDYKYPRINTESPIRVGGKDIWVNVIVNCVGAMTEDLLSELYPESGFASVREWLNELQKINKSKSKKQKPRNWRVYKAELVK
ncbi:MAG: hypothetical protein OIN90_04585 [Candidatus Methanoperedens sp.]|nr:hypothetical protein [Candidatus Methanoperedens sp.]